jgi:hypothetical protein
LLLGESATLYLDDSGASDAAIPDRHIRVDGDDHLAKLQRQVELKLARTHHVLPDLGDA